MGMAIQSTVMRRVWLNHPLSVVLGQSNPNGYGTGTETAIIWLYTVDGNHLKYKIFFLYCTLSIQWCRAALAFAWARCNCFFTNIRIQMVLAWRLAWQREIVSWPPEKIYLTVTAEPAMKIKKYWCQNNSPGIHNISQARQNRFRNWACRPVHHWIGLQASKSSPESLKYSSSSLIEAFSFLWYRAVKDFWGEPMIGEVWADGEAMDGGVEMAACA